MSRILIGNVRDKLVNNLLATKAGTGALDAAQGKVLKDLVESVLGQQADAYNKKTYAVGDYCIYENALYKCNTAISSAEEWTAGHWTKTTIAAELKNIVGSVATVNNAITELNGKITDTLDFGKYNIKQIVFTSGMDSLYLRLPKDAWSKAYAFIVGADNIDGYIQEMVFANVNDPNNITCMYNSQSKIKKNWEKDESSNWNVHCNGGFKPYGNVIIIYKGFTDIGVYKG